LFARSRLALALALLAAFGATPVLAQRAELDRIIRRQVLPNGLEVIVVENHGVPLVTVEIDVRNGSFTQPPDYAGLAHLYEHMFFKANRDYPDAGMFGSRSSELGAVFNGTTTEERVNYYMTLSSDSLEGAVRLMASALRAPLFLAEELAREKEIVLGEYDRAESNPFFGLTHRMTDLLYPGQGSRKNTIGDRAVISRVTPAQMREIQRLYYVPNNTALLVTGDVNPDSVFALARRVLGDWPRGADPFVAAPVPPVAPLTANAAVVAEAAVSAVTVLLQWQGPSVRRDPGATYAADVFSDLLNQPGGRFQQRLVDSGLWQGVGVNYYTLDQNGPITISGQTTPERMRDALRALDREIAAVLEPGYFSADALREVQAQRTVGSAFGRERTSGFTHTVGFWWAVADLEYYMGYVDAMAKQTPADLQRYARTYIVGKPRVAGVLLSAADRRQIGLTEAELRAAGAAR